MDDLSGLHIDVIHDHLRHKTYRTTQSHYKEGHRHRLPPPPPRDGLTPCRSYHILRTGHDSVAMETHLRTQWYEGQGHLVKVFWVGLISKNQAALPFLSNVFIKLISNIFRDVWLVSNFCLTQSILYNRIGICSFHINFHVFHIYTDLLIRHERQHIIENWKLINLHEIYPMLCKYTTLKVYSVAINLQTFLI